MVIVGYPWLSLVVHGYCWLSMVIDGYPWLSLVIHGYVIVNSRSLRRYGIYVYRGG